MVVAPGAARWPAWFAPAGFLIALGATLVLASIVTGVGIFVGVDDEAPALTVVATLIQDGVLVATAVVLASRVGRPRAQDFGLAPTPVRRAILMTVVALVAFYTFSAVYGALLRPEQEQDTLEQLGTDRGTGYLLASAAVVILLAPLVEELFFRGFMYRALRNRWSPWVAASIVGLVFGSIHYAGPDTLKLLPVLALLGATFCWLYEATGSLYPAIAMHAINNTLAFTATAESSLAVPVGLSLGFVTVVACVVVPGRRRSPV